MVSIQFLRSANKIAIVVVVVVVVVVANFSDPPLLQHLIRVKNILV